MPRNTLVLDGLWYCLCPSFSFTNLPPSGLSFIRGKRSPRNGYLSAISASPRRCLSSNSARSVRERDAHSENDTQRTDFTGPLLEFQISHQLNTNRNYHRDANILPQASSSTHAPPPGVPKNLENRTTPHLENKLQELTAKTPRVLSTTQILRILIRDRHVRPEVRHYRALILANSDAERGSPEVVRQLLSEMEANGIPADSGTLHAALQVLAVHPDYLLRQEISRTLRDRWLPLSPAGWHYVVAGLLRENQFELAVDHIAHMERKDILVENWLHSLLIYSLCDIEDFDEVVRLMRKRTSQGHDMTSDLWLHVLDVASAAVHHETTCYVWTQMVELRYLNPSYEVCGNVLTVASRTGDTELASSVIRFLVDTDVPVGLNDYKKLVEAHVTAGNLYSGFEILCKMHKSGIGLKRSATQPIFDYMVQMRTSPREAWSMLKQLKSLKYEIPMSCAQAVIEVCEHEALNDPFVVDEGVALYKELYALCPGKADVSIYNALIGMCRRAKTTEAGMFIVKEMATLGVVPDTTTFEHLIIMCLDAGNFESGYMYYQDLLERGSRPSDDTLAQIRDICSGSKDPFAIQLRHHPQIRDENVRDQVGYRDPAYELPFLIKKVASDPLPQYANRSNRSNHSVREDWSTVSKEARRAASKERRKRKRRRLAIAKAQEEDDWMDYEPGGLIPEDQLKVDETHPS